MAQVTKKKKRSSLKYQLVVFISLIITVITLGYFTYTGFFPIFYLIPAGILLVGVQFWIAVKVGKRKTPTWMKIILSLICLLLSIAEIFAMTYGVKTEEFIFKLIDDGKRVTSYGVYVLKDSNYNKLEDLKDKKITYLNSEDDTEIREALGKVESEITIKDDYLDSLDELIKALEAKETDSIFFDTSYEDVIKEEFEDSYDNIKLIYSVEMEDQIKTLQSNKDITKDTFTIYLSGIDTTGKKVSAKARSDVNILLTINPKTNEMLMVSTPRDSFVTLHTKQKGDKLTHAGIYGIEESVKTLEDLYDVKVDYYARVNFQSFMSIVNTLGGITIDVPKSFCEQNSQRSKKQEDLICLKKGKRTLNGEQALAYARNRHNFSGGDFARGEHQMEIMTAILKKCMSPSILSKYTKLLESLEGKVTTNMSKDDITKFINKNLGSGINFDFKTMALSGTLGREVCASTGKSKLSVVKLKEEDITKAQDMIKEMYEGHKSEEESTTTSTTKKP